MTRAWIAAALLAGSWLWGLSYFEVASPLGWTILVAAGTLLLVASPALEESRECDSHAPLAQAEAAAALVLLVPLGWFAPWPYRAAPLALIAGLVLWLLPAMSRWGRRFASGCLTAGLVLLVQSLVLIAYASETARNHDLPWPVPDLLAGLARLQGIDAAADGPLVILHTLRQTHRLAVTWELLLDPVTICFLFGGLAMLAVWARSRLPAAQAWPAWLDAARRLTLIVLAWVPFRTGLLVAVYVHRAARADPSLPLHVMNHFLSPWVHLLLLAVPTLLAWRWIRLPGDDVAPAAGEGIVPVAGAEAGCAARPHGWRRLAAAAVLIALGVGLLAIGFQWDPVGRRKPGRVTFVDRHSTWEPTDRPYDTQTYGGPEDEQVSYTYTLAYHYLGQFYAMSRLRERDRIDDAALAECDVLVVKVPTARYTPQEVEAVVRFVESGGGLLLIGDHTNFEKSSTTMNDMTRHFGFVFRDDVLYSEEPAPDQQRYTAPRVPHPAVQHVPWFDFAVSCSVDPGRSWGRAVIQGTRLWGLPPEYHNANYMPFAQHSPEMRYGAFIQAWTTRFGKGRALAFADSTIFSSFSIYQPGKAELLLNLIEWLNHDGPRWDPRWLVIALGVLGAAAGGWLAARGCRAGTAAAIAPQAHGVHPCGMGLVLLGAAGCGWVAGSEAVVAMHRAAMPWPQAQRPMPQVVIDRTTSRVPLALGAFNEDKQGQGYALLEQWIPRLGYTTTRAAGANAMTGDALVVICPSRPADQAFRDRLVRYVAEGGRLLVIDSGLEGTVSTANGLLRPFGLTISYAQSWQGELNVVGQWPGIRVERAWEVLGGREVASLGHERTVCAEVRFGQGRVMAVGFGSLFNDAGMGGDWGRDPDDKELQRYQVLFALMRLLVEDQPIVAPAPPKSLGPKPPSSIRPRLPRPAASR